MFIHLNRSDLVAGYDRVRGAQASMPSRYRQQLLEAYGRRIQRYNHRMRRARAWRRRSKLALFLLSLVLVIVCGAGFWLSVTGSPIGLVLFCLGGMLVVVFAVFGWMLGSEPHQPENPLGKDEQGQPTRLKTHLFPDLTRQWLGGLATQVPDEAQVEEWVQRSGKHGLVGELNLVRALSAALPPDTFILHSLTQNFGDDLDVVVVGSCGVWLFEVKYLHAEISYHGGRWNFRQYNHNTGRVEPVDLGEPPDKQWLRMRDEIRRTLAFNGRPLVRRVRAVGDIQGGIVFAHPGASFEIELSPPFAWSDIPGWVRTLKQAPPVPGMDLRTQLEFLDLVLERHQELKPYERLVSMDEQAARIVEEAEKRIEGWLRG
jgi:hypothetical protein